MNFRLACFSLLALGWTAPLARPAEPTSAELRAALEAAVADNQHEEVARLVDALLKQASADGPVTMSKSAQAELHHLRGRARFCQARMRESLADFDQVVALDAPRERQLWERGIVLYYLGQYQAGAKQFELYQTYYDQDVENSVWRYLCQVRESDSNTARKDMLPIQRDPRVPMMEIYRLFRGEATVDDVLAAADRPATTKEELLDQQFFAHLYVGLYYESQGNEAAAAEHIGLAAGKYGHRQHYMWQVANVHCQLRGWQKAAGAGRPDSQQQDPPPRAPDR